MANISFIEQSHEILRIMPEDLMSSIVESARVCYRSEANASPENNERLLRNLISSGHEAMLEFGDIKVRFRCDRGVSHEMVRHRIASYAQESTRYVNYGKRGFEFILPVGIDGSEDAKMRMACRYAAQMYESLVSDGCRPEIARCVLPNATATTVDVKANVREWRNILRLRCGKRAHPQIRALMVPLLRELQERCPILFDDIEAGE